MKVQVMSDLHFDVDRLQHDVSLSPEADVLVVAGDVCEGLPEAFSWLRNKFGKEIPIVTVAGNHSFYRRYVREELLEAKKSAKEHGVQFLENEACEIGGVRFIGTTLWTDYCLQGRPFRVSALLEAKSKMNDHKCIALQKQPWKRFQPQDAERLHHSAISYLSAALHGGPDANRKTVVVTHHSPSMKSVLPRYQNELLTCAYASSLEQFVAERRPAIWAHGHLHNSSDYDLGDTRVICNPHGYGLENPSFEPHKLVEIRN